MAQTQTKAQYVSEGEVVEYTPSSAVYGGDVVLIGSVPMVAPVDIAANAKGALACAGIYDIPQKAEIFTAGDAVYWDVDGTPVTGTALTGAATGTASAGYLIGTCITTTAATDTYVRTRLTAVVRSQTVAGAVTATDITGSDASLGVNGIEAAQGGAIVITGGTSDTAGNAGGAVSLVGGTPGATGVGGACAVTGGAGGATSGTGGAITITGGAGTNGNANGGAVTINAGAANGSGTAGAIAIGVTNAASITLGKPTRVATLSSVAVGGTAIGNANNVLEGTQIVTGADDSKAVILPVAVDGMQVKLISTTASKKLVIFPQVGSIINNLGANNSYTSATNAPHISLQATSATQWYVLGDIAG